MVGGLVSPHIPNHVGPPSLEDGNRPIRLDMASTISGWMSLHSLNHAKVSSSEFRLATSSASTSARNMISNSTSPTSKKYVLVVRMYRPHWPGGNQSRNVLMTVSCS